MDSFMRFSFTRGNKKKKAGCKTRRALRFGKPRLLKKCLQRYETRGPQVINTVCVCRRINTGDMELLWLDCFPVTAPPPGVLFLLRHSWRLVVFFVYLRTREDKNLSCERIKTEGMRCSRKIIIYSNISLSR